jgi:hypothetical protein
MTYGASVQEAREKVTRCLNQIACRSWLKQEHPHITNKKWFDLNTVILYYGGIGVAIVSMECWNNIRLRAVDKLFVSNSYIFVSYDEETLFCSIPSDMENNIVSIFSRDGAFELGIQDLMDKDHDSWQFDELEAGYITKDKFGHFYRRRGYGPLIGRERILAWGCVIFPAECGGNGCWSPRRSAGRGGSAQEPQSFEGGDQIGHAYPGAGNPDGANDQRHAIVLLGEDMLDMRADFRFVGPTGWLWQGAALRLLTMDCMNVSLAAEG